MKYVMLSVRVGDTIKLVPIIFPDFLVHSDVADVVKNILSSVHHLALGPVFSAGDISFEEVECSGESTTLKLKSNPYDSDVIESYSYLHGIIT